MSTVERDTESTFQSRSIRHITMGGDYILPEVYHLEGGTNYGVWAYRMKNLLQKDGRFFYCLTPPSTIMGEEERMARLLVMSIINSNAKNSALKLLRRYHDPHECWVGLKTRYESDSGPRRVMLIEKFFSLRKTEAISMDAHLTEIKEVANLLEEVEVIIPEDIIVYYTLKNLPKEYDIFKRMQIAASSLPTYEQLEAKLISEETSIKLEKQQQDEGEVFFSQQDRFKRSHPSHRGTSFPTTVNSRRFGSFENTRRPGDFGRSSNSRSNYQTDSGGFNSSRHHPGSSLTRSSESSPRTNSPTHYQPRYRTKGPEKPRGDKCHFCGLDGHFERECDIRSMLDRMKDFEHRLLQQRGRSAQVHNLEETDPFIQDQEPHDLESADQVVDACLVELNLLETPHHTASWYLDSGATHHVSGDSSVFTSISPTSGTQIRSAGGQSHNVNGVGNTDIQISSGEIKTISSVLYSPGITKNLLSVGSLTDQNKTLVFKTTGCFIIDDTTYQVEAFAPREGSKGLYRLFGACPNQPEVHLAQSHSQTTLWHKRLGHFHSRGLQRMITSSAVRGLPQLRFSKHTCDACLLGKHTRTKLQKQTSHQTSRILELVHSDVCGPFRTTSLGGARYFVSFIDDFSRHTWLYFISQKSQVLSKFKNFVTLMKTSTGKSIQALRTDNGGEFTSHDFLEFCSSEGISREPTPPYTPQRNGVAERRNRSLLDITRCLLLDQSLPGHLWGEAVKAAADILNLRSTKRHPNKTPHELFYGTKPSIAHLRIFGSPVFVHVPKTLRSKLEPRSEKCILLSFDSNAKAYRCYRPTTKRVFVSRDLFIDEAPLLTPRVSSTSQDHSTPLSEDTAILPTSAPTRTEELRTLLDASTSSPTNAPAPMSTEPQSSPTQPLREDHSSLLESPPSP